MGTNRKILICCFSLFAACAMGASKRAPKRAPQSEPIAAPPPVLTTSGHFEAGIAGSFGGSATPGLQWLVDNFELHHGYAISPATSVTLIHGFAANNVSALKATGRAQDSASFFSPVSISTSPATATTAPGGLTYHAREAYITHRFSENFAVTMGLFRNVFGLENLIDRYQLPTYYHSRAHGLWQAMGWNYNLGVKLDIAGFEMTFFQALDSSGRNRPSLALRYKRELTSGDWSLTPVFSIYAGKFFVGPKDIGVSAGLMAKRKNLFGNFEAVFGQRSSIPAGTLVSRDWSIVAEPGLILPAVTLSVKGELTSNMFPIGLTDLNLGIAVTKTFDKFRARLLYSHINLRGSLGSHANELRLLFGAEW
jgi:hypothetical protein